MPDIRNFGLFTDGGDEDSYSSLGISDLVGFFETTDRLTGFITIGG